MIKDHETFMLEAIALAQESGQKGDYPIGAVIVKDGKIISRGYETLKSLNDPVNGHAEIDAIRKASRDVLKKPYLDGCILYTSHEPCPMCTAAAFWAKIKTVVYSVSRQDMIEHMNSNSKFSWRQIDISCQDILDKGKGFTVEVVPDVCKQEGLKLFSYTK